MKETKFSKLYLSNLWEMHDELPELQQQIKRLIENKMEKEKWVEITTKPNDLLFYTVNEPIIGIWFEQECNSHRFKTVDGKRYYHINGEDKKYVSKKQKLLNQLQALQSDKDYERAGSIAQDLLLAYIGDKDITEAYNKINKY